MVECREGNQTSTLCVTSINTVCIKCIHQWSRVMAVLTQACCNSASSHNKGLIMLFTAPAVNCQEFRKKDISLFLSYWPATRMSELHATWRNVFIAWGLCLGRHISCRNTSQITNAAFSVEVFSEQSLSQNTRQKEQKKENWYCSKLLSANPGERQINFQSTSNQRTEVEIKQALDTQTELPCLRLTWHDWHLLGWKTLWSEQLCFILGDSGLTCFTFKAFVYCTVNCVTPLCQPLRK